MLLSGRRGAREVRRLTLEYWIDDGWLVGRIREEPGVYGQGTTLTELVRSARASYRAHRERNAAELRGRAHGKPPR